ncbi:MAG: hypothetical protein ABII81_04680 [Pseudomonadota bacterium]
MKTTIPERIALVKEELGIVEDTEFGKLCGMSKSVVNQLKSGLMKSFAPRYAYKLEENTGFSARWMMLGDGAMRLDPSIRQAVKIMEAMSDSRRKDAVKIITPLAEPDGDSSSSSLTKKQAIQ